MPQTNPAIIKKGKSYKDSISPIDPKKICYTWDAQGLPIEHYVKKNFPIGHCCPRKYKTGIVLMVILLHCDVTA